VFWVFKMLQGEEVVVVEEHVTLMATFKGVFIYKIMPRLVKTSDKQLKGYVNKRHAQKSIFIVAA
jgi:hypothetical protein